MVVHIHIHHRLGRGVRKLGLGVHKLELGVHKLELGVHKLELRVGGLEQQQRRGEEPKVRRPIQITVMISTRMCH